MKASQGIIEEEKVIILKKVNQGVRARRRRSCKQRKILIIIRIIKKFQNHKAWKKKSKNDLDLPIINQFLNTNIFLFNLSIPESPSIRFP